MGNASMAKDPQNTFYECDETFDEDRTPSWPFATEDDEHRYFDNLDRVADIRSTYK